MAELFHSEKFSTLRNAGNVHIKPEKMTSSLAANSASRAERIAKDREVLGSEKPNGDENYIDKMYKELLQRNQELEDKLKSMDCGMSCLRSDSEKQASRYRSALEKAEADVKLASRSRNLAMDLAKQSRDQIDTIKASRDEIVDRISHVSRANEELQAECDRLRSKLAEIEDDEKKKCTEADDEIKRIKYAAEQKAMALTSEKSKLEKTVSELTNQAKIQKKRISDLTSICTNQRDLICENDNCIALKTAQLAEAENKIETANCRCREMQEEIENLQCKLNETAIARKNLENELDKRQDTCDCELRIKTKIIEDQVETIKKLKKLLQDSERMAHQAACEFESLRDELHCLKQCNKSLRMALEELEARTNDENDVYCDRCYILEEEIKHLDEQRQKAMTAAKLAASKLCSTSTEYERQLDSERRRSECANSLIERQSVEIRLLKKEILCGKEFRSRRSNDYINRQ